MPDDEARFASRGGSPSLLRSAPSAGKGKGRSKGRSKCKEVALASTKACFGCDLLLAVGELLSEIGDELEQRDARIALGEVGPVLGLPALHLGTNGLPARSSGKPASRHSFLPPG